MSSSKRTYTVLSLAGLLASLANTSGCAGQRLRYTANVIQWSEGAARRSQNGAPPSAYLMLIDAGSDSLDDGLPLTDCLPSDVLLPDPFALDTPQIYVLVDASLWRVIGHLDPQLERIEGLPAGFVPQRLLGFEYGSEGSRMLVSGRSEVAPNLNKTAKEELWLLELADGVISGVRELSSRRIGQSKLGFFSRFELPRCLSNDSSCLVVSNDEVAGYVDIEPQRDSQRQAYMEFTHARIYDAAWAGSSHSQIYLLVDDSCGSDDPATSST